jgi:hypothetical protein
MNLQDASSTRESQLGGSKTILKPLDCTYVKVTDQNLVSRQTVRNNESRAGRVSDPMEHTDPILHHGSQIRIKMNCHHRLI